MPIFLLLVSSFPQPLASFSDMPHASFSSHQLLAILRVPPFAYLQLLSFLGTICSALLSFFFALPGVAP